MSENTVTPEHAAAKAEEARRSKAATELLPKLRQYFGADRWARLLDQMQQRGINEDNLALHLVGLREAHPCSDPAWPVQAAHLGLIFCGSVPGPGDFERLQAVINGDATAAVFKLEKKGGKHDPAPPPAN